MREYRIRHDRVVARASGNSIDALRARLLLLTGVLDAYVADNAERPFPWKLAPCACPSTMCWLSPELLLWQTWILPV